MLPPVTGTSAVLAEPTFVFDDVSYALPTAYNWPPLNEQVADTGTTI